MFWNSVWDDEINYSKTLNKFLLSNDVFYKIINNLTSVNIFRKNFNFFKKYKKYKKYSIFNINKKNIFNIQKQYNLKNYKIYTSKIWFIKYTKWIIILCFFINEVNVSKKYKNTINYNLLGNFKKTNFLF